MRLSVGMRTAQRQKRNYLGVTLRGFAQSGGDVSALHLALSDGERAWMLGELADLPCPRLTVSPQRLKANANGLAVLEACLRDDAEMIVLLEDDLAFCQDFVGSLSRWLDGCTRRDRHVYRCFGFTTPPKAKVNAYDWPLAGLRASQTIILWADEARDFLAWGRQHLTDWVGLAPWGRQHVALTDPHIGFDKFVATWALLTWPKVPSVISHPYFVKHIGDESSLHRFGARNDRPFAGTSWRFQEAR